jgi:hypothetical protein
VALAPAPAFVYILSLTLLAAVIGCEAPPPAPRADDALEAALVAPVPRPAARPLPAPAPLPPPKIEMMPGGGMRLGPRIDHVQALERQPNGKYRRTCAPPLEETRAEMERVRSAGAARVPTEIK